MPPKRDWRLRVADIVQQAELLLSHTEGVDWARFESDDILQGNVLYRLSVIGEAVASIPDEVRLLYPEVPWRDIRNMRNVITHVYFGVDLARVWDVVETDLPVLLAKVRAVQTDEAS